MSLNKEHTGSFYLKTRTGKLGIGKKYPIRVNCNIGISGSSTYETEKLKITELFKTAETTPDIMMDLSISQSEGNLVKFIIENYPIPLGIVPVYSVYNFVSGINKQLLLEYIIENAKLGVSFFTLHFTASLKIYNQAKKDRLIPVTSRGGALLLSDMIINNRKHNVLLDLLPELILLAKKYDFAISLGSTFRPAGIQDACDKSHIAETKQQLKICKYLQENGVKVIVENIGHIDINKLQLHSKLLHKFAAPIMPLGPLPTDNSVGNDHIASAIGACFAGYLHSANIINSITPNEHNSSDFSIEDIKDGIKAAKIAAHIINLLNSKQLREIDNQIYQGRASNKSCLQGEKSGCLRCDLYCPLNLIK